MSAASGERLVNGGSAAILDVIKAYQQRFGGRWRTADDDGLTAGQLRLAAVIELRQARNDTPEARQRLVTELARENWTGG